MRTHKGIFKPRHPEKYKGNPTNIVYRSMWEFQFMYRLDHDETVEWWQSEETAIAYANPTKAPGRISRYFPDMIVKYKDGRTIMYEIKPHKQTLMPVNKGNKKQFFRECMEFAKNEAKWATAKEYCKKRGFEFKVLTEKELGIR